jgi:ectoine hydroxylase-related dioxygenase (phytanoyl-CoA dioxygenase family)
VPFIDQSAVLSSLIDDPRIHGIATSLLGDDFNYMGSDGNYYVGDTGWHPDGRHETGRYIKIAFYLDQLDGTNGALRVIPGSHHLGGAYREALEQLCGDPLKGFGVHGRDVPAQVLSVRPGDILVFNHNTYHSSWNGGSRRRMFTMNLCQRYPQERLKDLQEYLATHARFHIERNVGPEMLRNASAQRMRHLEQVMANDFLLGERVRELKAKGVEPSRG